VADGLTVARGLQGVVEAALELASVDEPGQRIVARLVGERALQTPLLAHIVEDHHHADRVAAAIADRCGGVLDRDLDTAAIDQHGVLEHLDHAAFAQATLDGIRERLAAVLGHEPDDRRPEPGRPRFSLPVIPPAPD
jgi:hypothetical protein